MKLRFIVFVLVALFALPALAQDSATHTVSFDGFSFSFDESVGTNVNITRFAGDPPDLDQPGGPQVAHTQFALYSQLPVPEFGAPGEIRVYQTADFAGYETSSERLTQLQTLLADRPDLASFMATDITAENPLPFMPVFAAAQVIRARAQYIDTGSVSGISYITAYRQDVAPFIADSFLYTFQGISADGAHHVSAIFPVNTALFPADFPTDLDIEEFSANYAQYLSDSVSTLNNAGPQDFTPSLTTLDAIVSSFAFTTGGAAPTPEAPQATPTEVLDPTLGGLADTWNLVSYGDPVSPLPVLATAPISVTFAPDGVSGTAGCNQFGGASFQYDANTITFGQIVSTEIACADDIMAQENAFLAALGTTTTFEVGNGQLQIFYDSGVLTFVSATAPPETPEATDPTLGGLAGTWTLVSYGDPNNPQPVVGQTPPTLTLAPDGASGNGGCNQFGTPTFAYDGNAITFGQIVSTLMACADEAAMAQETVYLAALQAATTYALTDGQLQIAYDGGVLNFTAAQ